MQAVAQRTKAVAFFDQLNVCDAGGRAERNRPGGVLGARPKATLLAAATSKRLGAYAGANIKRANALGCVHLVPDDGEQVDVQFGNVDWNLADRLGGIGVQQGAVLMGDGGEFGDRLQHTGLIIRVHDRHQARRLAQRCPQIVEIYEAIRNRKIGRLDAMSAAQRRACTEDSRMLGGLSDHVPAVDSENPP